MLLNIGSNAADAMPSGGKLILKTTDIRVTKEGIHDLIGITPGDYVLLTVSDTGYGMGKEASGTFLNLFFLQRLLKQGLQDTLANPTSSFSF